MEGITIGDDLEFPTPSSERTLVLVGRTGNGKSATGNSILGKKAFTSRLSAAGVTSTCELQRTVLKDGMHLNVIDTPGLFDSSMKHELIAEEIVRCVNMAKHGIDAVLVVFSARNRFTREEGATFESLRTIFGTKISDYIIVIFTGGDVVNEDYLVLDGHLKEILHMFGKRVMLFDNRTRDEHKKHEQLMELLSLVDAVVDLNGKPYMKNIEHVDIKSGTVKIADFSVNQVSENIEHVDIKPGTVKIADFSVSQVSENIEHGDIKPGSVKIADFSVSQVSEGADTKEDISKLNEQLHTSYGKHLKRIAAFLFYAFMLYYFVESNKEAAQK